MNEFLVRFYVYTYQDMIYYRDLAPFYENKTKHSKKKNDSKSDCD